MSEQKLDPSTGQFIDPMFAVMIAAAVSETIIFWAKSGIVPETFPLLVVIAGYTNLLLSWFGYHKSISKRPILGSLRFIITVVLLPLYLLTIILAQKSFYCVALVYVLIFFLWSAWEYLKYIEHGEERGFLSLQNRSYNWIVYVSAAYLTGLKYLPHIFQFIPDWFITHADAICLSAITFSIVFLRISKSAGKEGTPASKIVDEIKTLLFGKRTDTE